MSLERKNEKKQRYTIDGKLVQVYPSAGADKPVVYLNTFGEEGDQIYDTLQKINCPDFTLAAISGLNWDHDMAPWGIPPISADDTPCTGGADEYLKLLVEEIVPRTEKLIQGDVVWRGLAGYSLAGLFAVYSMYHTELFSRAASISGSLWFPGFTEYLLSHEMKRKPEFLYFSLGDRESKTGNPYLKVVQEQTEKIEHYYKNQGISTIFQMNPGGHFKNAVRRTAAGIASLMQQK